MANQSTGDSKPSFIVWYEEPGNSKHLELSDWAKRRLAANPPFSEALRRWVVEKRAALRKIGIAIALGFSYTRANNK